MTLTTISRPIKELDMERTKIINKVGVAYLTSNIENEEFKYSSAYKDAGLEFHPIKALDGSRIHDNLDIRFVKDGVSVLIETKRDFNDGGLVKYKHQLNSYVEYEKGLTGNKIIAILANTGNDEVMVWRGAVIDSNRLYTEQKIKTIDEYVDIYLPSINNKEQVMRATYDLNEMLHAYGISEKLRSQFVGTCLLALKNNLEFKTQTLTASQIRAGIKAVLESLLNNDINKAEKLALLNKNVIESQDVRNLTEAQLREILTFINGKILPFINDRTTAGQDLLNLFFITFNKYTGKADKNQAFTPDHISDFMNKVCRVNKDSIVIDPCCGSGAFLVRAMTQELDDCLDREEQELVKKQHIYGIEFEEVAYGLSTTNMLIHGDGNSNIVRDSCFNRRDWIKEAKPNVVLMNPPYNATQKCFPKSYVDKWPKKNNKPCKEDPSKGFYFVKYMLDIMNENNTRGKLAVLLPVSCAIGNSKEILEIRKQILEKNTLDAVFSLPAEVFYPGASASACCMVFDVGVKHKDSGDTYFGYCKEDGFKKKKKLGRIEQVNSETGKSRWDEIENEWLTLYKNRTVKDGLSALHKVDYQDEWLCEAYMKTDYSKLTEADFQRTLNNYLAYLVKEGKIEEAKDESEC